MSMKSGMIAAFNGSMIPLRKSRYTIVRSR